MAIYPVKLDKLYENMDEASVGRWLVSPGQRVSRGDVVGELVSDKMNAEVEAPSDAYVADILIPENRTVPFGTVLVVLTSSPGEDYDRARFSEENRRLLQAAEALAAPPEPFSAASAPRRESPPAAGFRAAPAARIHARKLGIDLQDVADFVKRPTIHKPDVEAYWKARTASAVVDAPPKAFRPDQDAAAVSRQPDPKRSGGDAPPRTALVTGASGGIGAAIARRLAARGCRLVLQGNRHPERLDALAAELRKLSSSGVTVLQADLLRPEGLAGFLAALRNLPSGIDILVNAAGIVADAPLACMTDAQWNSVLQLDLTVPFHLIRELAMPMARRRWGRIVNIASAAGRMGAANRANYAAAKAGLVGLTRSAAQELAGMGITVNAVSPGFIDTEMTAAIPDRRREAICRTIPLRRFGDARDVAALADYLASEEAAYITGQDFSVDGGLT